MSIYGYCRISTPKQSMERQIRNIKKVYPDAVIVQEIFTGTKVEGRTEFVKMLKNLKPGDTLVFDSVSRMSRDADQGLALYEHLYNKGINLEFLKEPMINTKVYTEKENNKLQLTGEASVDAILKGVNESMSILARKQIRIAFEQSQKEVEDLQQRTKESLAVAKAKGVELGLKKGTKLETAKSKRVKLDILKWSADFGGLLADLDVINRTKVSRNTYYKYKKELKEELYRKAAQQLKDAIEEDIEEDNDIEEEYKEEIENKPNETEKTTSIQATIDTITKEDLPALIEALKQKFNTVN